MNDEIVAVAFRLERGATAVLTPEDTLTERARIDPALKAPPAMAA